MKAEAVQILLTFLAIFLGFTLFPSAKSSAQEETRKVSDYKTFTEICLKRKNLSKITERNIEQLVENLLRNPFFGFEDRSGKTECVKAGKLLSSYSTLEMPDFRLQKFQPNLERLTISNGDSITEIKDLELFKNLKYLNLTISSLDRLRNIKLNSLITLDLTITGKQLSSREDIFESMPQLGISGRFTPKKGLVTVYDFDTLYPTIILRGKYLSDIKAIKSAKGIFNILIEKTNVSDISPLSTLKNLKSMEINSSPIYDISPISSLEKLSVLQMFDVPISEISPLGSMKKLEQLTIDNAPVANISSLSVLGNLTNLTLSNTLISDFRSLSPLKNLEYLDLRKNQIYEITPLSDFSDKLIVLFLNCNVIEDVSPLKDLIYKSRRLRVVILDGNKIKTLDSLKYLPSSSMDLSVSGNVVAISETPPNFTNYGSIAELANSNTLSRSSKYQCK
jgi:Leucine-rich repeat (LRR) protein